MISCFCQPLTTSPPPHLHIQHKLLPHLTWRPGACACSTIPTSTLCNIHACTVVLRKRTHGRCTLPWAQTGRWANIWAINIVYYLSTQSSANSMRYCGLSANSMRYCGLSTLSWCKPQVQLRDSTMDFSILHISAKFNHPLPTSIQYNLQQPGNWNCKRSPFRTSTSLHPLFIHISSLGAIPKKHSNKWHLILHVDLSHPAHHSISDRIDKPTCSLTDMRVTRVTNTQ